MDVDRRTTSRHTAELCANGTAKALRRETQKEECCGGPVEERGDGVAPEQSSLSARFFLALLEECNPGASNGSNNRADHRVPSHVLPLHQVGEALRRRHRRLERDGGIGLAVHEVIHLRALSDHSPASSPCRCECEGDGGKGAGGQRTQSCLLYTSPSPRDA